MSLAAHRFATPALAAVSFIESSVFPIPPDVLLIPMVLAEREKAFRIALVCTIASVLGGMLGYAGQDGDDLVGERRDAGDEHRPRAPVVVFGLKLGELRRVAVEL